MPDAVNQITLRGGQNDIAFRMGQKFQNRKQGIRVDQMLYDIHAKNEIVFPGDFDPALLEICREPGESRVLT